MDFQLTDRFALIRHMDSTHAQHPVEGPLARNA
jgi:hypothetical protein